MNNCSYFHQFSFINLRCLKCLFLGFNSQDIVAHHPSCRRYRVTERNIHRRKTWQGKTMTVMSSAQMQSSEYIRWNVFHSLCWIFRSLFHYEISAHKHHFVGNLKRFEFIVWRASVKYNASQRSARVTIIHFNCNSEMCVWCLLHSSSFPSSVKFAFSLFILCDNGFTVGILRNNSMLKCS